jgi:Tfp pilus assembly protein PilF
MDENPRISDLRKKIEKDPGSRLFAQLAEELRKEGRLEEAIQVAYDGLAKHPAYPSARLTLARALLDSGRASEARPELEHIVKVAPDNILAGRLLGEALDTLGEPEAAVLQFERALLFSPGDKAMVAHLAALKARVAMAAPAPAPAPAGLPVSAPSAFAEAPPAALAEPASAPSLFAPEAEAPSIFAADSTPAPSFFTDDIGATPPSLFAEEASALAPPPPVDEAETPTVPFATPAAISEGTASLEAPASAAAAVIPEAVEAEAEGEAATIPFALSDAPSDFSESSASLPAFQFEEPTPTPAPPEPPPVVRSAPEPPPVPVVPPPVAPPPAPPAPPAPAFSLALDRDLASGTISPGAFNMAELQRHFEAIAAAERAAAAGNVPAPPAPPPPAPPPVVPSAPVTDTQASAPTIPFSLAPQAPIEVAIPSAGDTQPPAGGVAPEETFTFDSQEFETSAIDTAETMSITPPAEGFAEPPPAEPEETFRFEETQPAFEEPAAMVSEAPVAAFPADPETADSDLGSQTLPLTSLTLADLYLQQGLKAEAAAVLSQVVRDEPANAQARSKLADVSAETQPEPAEHLADQGAAAEAPALAEVPASRARTPAEVRAATIAALKAFQGAIEREALAQKATEIRAR